MPTQNRNSLTPYLRVAALAGSRSESHPTPLPIWQRILLGVWDLITAWTGLLLVGFGLSRQSSLIALGGIIAFIVLHSATQRLRWWLADRRLRAGR